jgi:hypothetical protein
MFNANYCLNKNSNHNKGKIKMKVTQFDNFLSLSTGDLAILFKMKKITKLLSINPVGVNGVFNLDVKEREVNYATNVDVQTVATTEKGYIVSIKLTENSKTATEPYFVGLAGCHSLTVSLRIDDQYIQLDQFSSSDIKKSKKWSKIAFYTQSLEYSSMVAFKQNKSQIVVKESIIDALKKAPFCKHLVSRYKFLCLDKTNPKDTICTDLVCIVRLSDSEYSNERIEKRHQKVYIYWGENMDSVIFETSGLKYSETYFQA